MTSWHPVQPYNDLPPLPPAVEVETRPVLKQCIVARAALAELKQAAGLIPNQGVLINALPLLEAQASSEIENIVTTTDRLFQYQSAGEHADPATREALRHSNALLEGFRALKQFPLNTRTAEQVCTRIKGTEMQVRRVPGTALANQATGEVIYTPPVGENVLRSKLANWERYLHEARDVDPLIRMAVGHYQFEAIHPFTDGNGRTGRIINSLYLVQQELLTLPILYLSRYFIRNKAEYYRLLLDVTRNQAWEPWILYVLHGVEDTARWTTEKISAIRDLAALTVTHVKQAAPKIYSRELVDLIFDLPYCRIQNLVERNIAGRQAASRYLKQLVEIGVLQERAVGREKLFIHPKLMHLLTRDDNSVSSYQPPV
ncbi:MAG: Fic family protein [Burkholderiales bacterium]|nr:Fic family protein [Burkholderiales bacterium]MCA3161144.1 Fic family protein [Burkholderiales bacterium]MCA3164830.1 Fic family protein [Burkholderiales bacterium]MCA3166853.1 Fic family protein [Burkholderiales bacterium]MCA3170535.1 Fic family protein [Burkholderiales bacterium]